MIRNLPTSHCPGCGADLACVDGPTHPYMVASPACYERFRRILAAEYGSAALRRTHRLTVDTYAVQHPGDGTDRRQIQSVGLHLARLCVQLASPMPPRETNDVMLGFSRHKATLEKLEPPRRFAVTAADVAPHAGRSDHCERVTAWAAATWNDWVEHHDYIHDWIAYAKGE